MEWSKYEENQARSFIGSEIDLYGKNLDADECEEIAWEAYFEVREKYIYDLSNPDYWVCVGQKIKDNLEVFRKNRNERIKFYSPLSLNSQIGENGEELRSVVPAKHSDFSNSVVFRLFAESLDEQKYEIISLLVQQEEDYEIIRRLKISYEEYYREKLEIKNIFEREYL